MADREIVFPDQHIVPPKNEPEKHPANLIAILPRIGATGSVDVDNIDPYALLRMTTIPQSLSGILAKIFEKAERWKSPALRRRGVMSILTHGSIDGKNVLYWLEALERDKRSEAQRLGLELPNTG